VFFFVSFVVNFRSINYRAEHFRYPSQFSNLNRIVC
jgi:hypothetical protein